MISGTFHVMSQQWRYFSREKSIVHTLHVAQLAPSLGGDTVIIGNTAAAAASKGNGLSFSQPGIQVPPVGMASTVLFNPTTLYNSPCRGFFSTRGTTSDSVAGTFSFFDDGVGNAFVAFKPGMAGLFEFVGFLVEHGLVVDQSYGFDIFVTGSMIGNTKRAGGNTQAPSSTNDPQWFFLEGLCRVAATGANIAIEMAYNYGFAPDEIDFGVYWVAP